MAETVINGGNGQRLALLFAYNGSHFDAFDRSKGENTVEGTLLNAMASLMQSSGQATLTSISKATVPEVGEHASRMVISFDISPPPATLPSADEINRLLPPFIRVFRIVPVTNEFSARRVCEARTFEYLIPTYVFARPSALTDYSYPEKDEDDEIYIPPASMPRGGLFNTMKRGKSLARRATARSASDAGLPDKGQEGSNAPLMPQHRLGTSASLDLSRNTVRRSQIPPEEIQNMKTAAENRNIFARMFSNFIDTLKGKKYRNHGSNQLKASLTSTLQRSKSYPSGNDTDNLTLKKAAANASNAGKGASSLSPERDPTFDLSRSGKPSEENFVATLKRSMSRHRNFDPAEYMGHEVTYHDPLNLPIPSEEERATLRGYRMTPSQYDHLRGILALFNGTHNWHNYVPGAAQDDPRCYIRILNVEASGLEQHEGMEWIRIKVQAQSFARYQIRRMMAMLIMVLRTNTPRSVVGNSYGFAKINIPEAPATFTIFDTPHYNNYNVTALKTDTPPVNFGETMEAVEKFRHESIHDVIYRGEREAMEFESWIRSIDNYSFLYTYFLNERGVITAPTQLVRIAK